ncbi:MAG: ATP-binding cassette domain-containing protein [Candidatus Dormibacteraeota bacterium]|nr:ATP-binding cassette domain-containing protein [Candidatus Dormibacteraeota bacterium]
MYEKSISENALAIEAQGLTKRFGSTRALAGVDLAIPRGSVYALLGPNGAGKTTAVRILATLLLPDAGWARVLGEDVVRRAGAVRRRIALTGQFATVDEDLTGWENLVFLGRLCGLTRAAARERAVELLASVGLERSARKQVKTFSGGMRRRIDLAASLIVPADLYFFDEPTTGLDPGSRAQVWEVIRSIVAGGATVLLTTQYLEEADRLADRIAVIDGGRVVAEGTPGQLKASVGGGTLQVRLADPARTPDARRMLTQLIGTTVEVTADPAALSVRMPAGAESGPASERATGALSELARGGVEVAEFALGQPSLDEVFLSLTRKEMT